MHVSIPMLFDRRRLDLQINANNLLLALFLDHARALAQFCKAEVRTLAQFQACCNQNAVNLETGSPFEFEQDVDQSRVTCTSAQYPASASEDRPRKGLHSPARLVPRDCPHLQSPWNHSRLEWIAEGRSLSHARLIGYSARIFKLCHRRSAAFPKRTEAHLPSCGLSNHASTVRIAT